MPGPRKCIVKLRDRDGVEHAVQVTAESWYEAAILGLRQFRRSAWRRESSLKGAKLRIEVWEPPTFYDTCVDKIENWLAQPGTSPRDMTLRKKLSRLLNE